jgi:hypothetical protein
MLDRYNSGSPSPSYHDSWGRSAAFFNPPKDVNNDDCYVGDLSPPIALPRAKVATVQHNPMPTIFHSNNQQLEYIDQREQRPIGRYIDDFRYNIPLQDRFQQQQQHTKGVQEF